MVKARSAAELDLMRRSGQITGRVLKKVLGHIQVGVTTLLLDQLVTKEIKKLGGQLAFPTVSGYSFASCITINEQVVHGIPSSRAIKKGDLVSVDLGTIFQGWFTDAAWSMLVDDQDKGKNKFLKVGEEALWKGIGQATEGNRIGDISAAIQGVVEGAGYSVVRSLVGHGIGKALHEEPEVPGYGKEHTGAVLKKGQSLAIEVIYTVGKPEVVLEKDDWTISSLDGSLGGLFEMTVIVGKRKAEVLTGLIP